MTEEMVINIGYIIFGIIFAVTCICSLAYWIPIMIAPEGATMVQLICAVAGKCGAK